jgi:hypothetical protein
LRGAVCRRDVDARDQLDAAVTVAAAVGLLLGGAADVALATFIVGLVVVTAELRFLSWARPSG